MSQDVNLHTSVCLFWGVPLREDQYRVFKWKVSVLEGEYMCCQLSVVHMLECVREGEGQRIYSPPQGLLSSWLDLCQAIWGAPVLYGARVKNGNANK